MLLYLLNRKIDESYIEPHCSIIFNLTYPKMISYCVLFFFFHKCSTMLTQVSPHFSTCFNKTRRHQLFQLKSTGIWMFTGLPGVRHRANQGFCGPFGPSKDLKTGWVKLYRWRKKHDEHLYLTIISSCIVVHEDAPSMMLIH